MTQAIPATNRAAINAALTAINIGNYSDRLVSYYTMDDGADANDIQVLDKSGNGLHLTSPNDPLNNGNAMWTTEAGALTWPNLSSPAAYDYFVSPVDAALQFFTGTTALFVRLKVDAGRAATVGIPISIGHLSTNTHLSLLFYANGTAHLRQSYNSTNEILNIVTTNFEGAGYANFLIFACEGGIYGLSANGGLSDGGQTVYASGNLYTGGAMVNPHLTIGVQEYASFSTGPIDGVTLDRVELYHHDNSLLTADGIDRIIAWKHAHYDSLLPRWVW